MNLSVIICTHNPRKDYLTRVLQALKAQTLPKDQWELLLIDNASDQELARSWDLSWHPHGRHIREDKTGLNFARARGFAEAQGEICALFNAISQSRSMRTSRCGHASSTMREGW